MTHMNEYLPERLAANPLQAMESDSDIEAIADAVISASVLRDCPRDTNGIRPEDDFCLGCYKRFAQGTAPTTRASIAISLSRALPEREG